MGVEKNVIAFLIQVSLVAYMLPSVSSSQEQIKVINSHSSTKDNHHKMNPELQFQIIVHGFLLWTSMGFLMPIGILIIRISNRDENGRRARIVFYVHAVLQMLAVLLGTAGAIMSIKNFNNSFNNNHQRVGVALYGIIWLQAILGIFRPQRESKRRSVWFFPHWIIGTAVTSLGVLNVYTGLLAYQEKTFKSIRIWVILFTIQVAVVVFLYLLQDKWVYMQKQGEVFSTGLQRTNSDDKKKELKAESC
ncbi:hypothetical protein L6164_029318 [Bauhinia variegata]|uniref:Uncharacterized protein n=1 Tax=Bauhinia variegata TaxID=167791 RepID=A0ACB9L9D3_BAUVA|nr:hypothetical protein L6164_029318 [Bauhinia variegata]